MKNIMPRLAQSIVGALFLTSVGIFSHPLANAEVCHTDSFLLGAYHDSFGFDQDPSDEDNAAWEEIIDGGLLTHEQVAQGLINTAEYRMHLVDTLYQRYLNRDADDAEKFFFNFLLSGGKTFDYLTATILGSAEYFEDKGGSDDGGFVVVLYEDLLGRSPSDMEYNKQLRLLTQGATRISIVEKLLTSKEGRQVLIQGVYNEILDRDPSPSELKSWLSKSLPTRRASNAWKYETLRASLIGSEEYCFHTSPAVGSDQTK
jgi:hypothetical protein